MNQYVVLRELSLAFAIRITSNWLTARLGQIGMNPAESGAEVPELHASAAGLKGYCCNATAIGLEELRKCCGGAGYLLASGIAPLVADYKWRATAEGDTTVMLLQTARYLMKAAADAAAGQALPGLVQCLAPLKDPGFNPMDARPPFVKTWEEFADLDFLVKLFEYRTISQVRLTRQALDARLKAGETFDDAWAALTLKAVRTGQSHVLYFMLCKFIEMVQQCEDEACRRVLERVCTLFALRDVFDGQQWSGLLDISQVELAEEAVANVCSMLRPDAVALVDAWDFPDRTLNSTIGGYDGNVYENQYIAAVKSPLNDKSVPDFFEVIKEFLDLDYLKLRNGLEEGVEPDDTSAYPDPEPPRANL